MNIQEQAIDHHLKKIQWHSEMIRTLVAEEVERVCRSERKRISRQQALEVAEEIIFDEDFENELASLRLIRRHLDRNHNSGN